MPDMSSLYPPLINFLNTCSKQQTSEGIQPQERDQHAPVCLHEEIIMRYFEI